MIILVYFNCNLQYLVAPWKSFLYLFFKYHARFFFSSVTFLINLVKILLGERELMLVFLKRLKFLNLAVILSCSKKLKFSSAALQIIPRDLSG